MYMGMVVMKINFLLGLKAPNGVDKQITTHSSSLPDHSFMFPSSRMSAASLQIITESKKWHVSMSHWHKSSLTSEPEPRNCLYVSIRETTYSSHSSSSLPQVWKSLKFIGLRVIGRKTALWLLKTICYVRGYEGQFWEDLKYRLIEERGSLSVSQKANNCGWKHGSAIVSVFYSSRGFKFSLQNPQLLGHDQLPVTSASGDPMPSSDPLTFTMVYISTNRHTDTRIMRERMQLHAYVKTALLASYQLPLGKVRKPLRSAKARHLFQHGSPLCCFEKRGNEAQLFSILHPEQIHSICYASCQDAKPYLAL